MNNTHQRIDKWLWCARIFKTRTLAAKIIAENGVRVTRNEIVSRVTKTSFGVHAGDVLTVPRGDDFVVLHIIGLADRRGPASEAQSLYVDLTPPKPPKEERAPGAFEREKGTGRPTKRDRRKLDEVQLPEE